nr:adrenodoxin-like protein 2, mitochondrial isoform X1 [Ipomoea batatas]
MFAICRISVTFVDKDGEEHHIKVPLGMSMLEAAHQNDIDLEGACEGSLACSTCHVIVMVCIYTSLSHILVTEKHSPNFSRISYE